MSNFVALTPPLSQQAWGPIAGGNAFLVALPANVTLANFSYPDLNCFFRALILTKYPGTIFPDPGHKDVFPCPDPDPDHVQELWEKFDDILGDPFTISVADVIERELSVIISEFDALYGPPTSVTVGTDLMQIDMPKSKKRARRHNSDLDAASEHTFENSSATEKTMLPPTKKAKKSKDVLASIPSLKSYYDAAFPTDATVGHEMPSYIMAKNYVDQYAQSNEKFAGRVREIIDHQGSARITQRFAKFFAWGLNQPIQHTTSVATAIASIPAATPASPISHALAPSFTPPTAAPTPVVIPTSSPIATPSTPASGPVIAPASTSTQATATLSPIADRISTIATAAPIEVAPATVADDGSASPTSSAASSQESFEYWEIHADAAMREPLQETEPFPGYVEPDLEEYYAIMEDMLDFNIADDDSSSDEEIINVVPLNRKPTFKFEPSALSTLLPGFVEEMKAANKKLEDAVRSGDDLGVEIGETHDGGYIEMNLGLGVLEEKSSEEEVEVKKAGIEEL